MTGDEFMAAAAKFTTGSPLRHVVVMTTTGSIGLMAVFAVDLANLFYISILGVRELAAAMDSRAPSCSSRFRCASA